MLLILFQIIVLSTVLSKVIGDELPQEIKFNYYILLQSYNYPDHYISASDGGKATISKIDTSKGNFILVEALNDKPNRISLKSISGNDFYLVENDIEQMSCEKLAENSKFKNSGSFFITKGITSGFIRFASGVHMNRYAEHAGFKMRMVPLLVNDPYNKGSSYKIIYKKRYKQPEVKYDDNVKIQSFNFPDHHIKAINGERAAIRQLTTKDANLIIVHALNGKSDSVSIKSPTGDYYLSERDDKEVSMLKYQNNQQFKNSASFRVVHGEETDYIRFESGLHSNHFMRHAGYFLKMNLWSDHDVFKKDSLFKIIGTAKPKKPQIDYDKKVMIQSFNNPDHHIKAINGERAAIRQFTPTEGNLIIVHALNGESDSVSIKSPTGDYYLSEKNDKEVSMLKYQNNQQYKNSASFRVARGEKTGYIRFESGLHSNHFMRHAGFFLKMNLWSDDDVFKKDSLFKIIIAANQ